MTPEAYGCLSVAYNALNSAESAKRWKWRVRHNRYEARNKLKDEKAQKLFAKANKLLKKRGQETLGDYHPRKIYQILEKPVPLFLA